MKAPPHIAVGMVLAALLAGCSLQGKWQSSGVPSGRDAGLLLESQGPAAMMRDSRPQGAPPVPMRERLRPCCAFGTGLLVDVAFLPVPGVRIDNVIGVDDLGPHRYDSGVLVIERDRGEGYSPSESNGLVYTCRGGFVDTAHVRDYVDWTMYLSSQIGRHLSTGVTIVLPEEGGERRVVLEALPRELIREHGLRELFSALAQWAGWQMSIWHEIATWYGWAAVPGFPESASAFSPEDLYSNLLGVKLIDAVIADKTGRTETLYNRSVGVWLPEVLTHLGAVDRETGERAIRAVDGHWWDSRERLPSLDLVRRRNVDLGPVLQPWRVPERRLSPELVADLDRQCGGRRDAQLLHVHDRLGSVVFSDWLRFEIELDEELRSHPAFAGYGPVVDQSDFPAIVEGVRAEFLARFGPRADRPE